MGTFRIGHAGANTKRLRSDQVLTQRLEAKHLAVRAKLVTHETKQNPFFPCTQEIPKFLKVRFKRC